MPEISDLSHLDHVVERVQEQLERSRRAVVLGGIGSGRTTLTKKLNEHLPNSVVASFLDLGETDVISSALLEFAAPLAPERREAIFRDGGAAPAGDGYSVALVARRLAEALVADGRALILRLPNSWNSLERRDSDWRAVSGRRASELLSGLLSNPDLPVALIASHNFPWSSLGIVATVEPLQQPRADLAVLEDDERWGSYLQAARNLLALLSKTPESRCSPIALRLAVGAVALGAAPERISDLLAARPAGAISGVWSELSARLSAAAMDALRLAIGRLLPLRRPVARERLLEIVHVPEEHIPLVTECLGYGDPVRVSGLVARRLQECLAGRHNALEPAHAGYAQYFESLDGTSTPWASDDLRAWTEKVHHLGRSGAAGQAAWNEHTLPSPDLYWDLARYLSMSCREYEAAAAVYERCVSKFEGDAYGWHYRGWNLQRAGLHREDAERSYRTAVDLEPDNPWWNGRLVTFLIEQGRPVAAREAQDAALDRVDPSGEGERSDIWIAENFNYWIAAAWLDAGFVEDAMTSLAPLSDEMVRASQRLRELAGELADAAEADLLGEAIYPPGWDHTLRWREPILLPRENKDGVRLERWYPGRVFSASQNEVRIIYADPGVDETQRRLLFTRILRDEWLAHGCGHPEDAQGYVELGRYTEDSEIVILQRYSMPNRRSEDIEASLGYLRKWSTRPR